jgi:hypothetical protein
MKNYGVRFGSGDPRTYTGINATFLFFVNMATGATVTPPSIAELFANTGIYNFQWGTTTPIAFLVDAATTTPGASGRYVSGQLDPNDRGDEYSATMIAIGTSHIAQGVTSIALGTTAVALGTTTVALGITSVSWGSVNNIQGSTIFSLGTTSVALGISNIALGTSAVNWGSVNNIQGSTLFAIGTTITAQGVSNAAQNVTILAQGLSITVAVAGVGTVASSYGSNVADPTDLFGYMKRVLENLEGNNTYNKVSGAFTFLSRGSTTILATKTITNSVSLVTKS